MNVTCLMLRIKIEKGKLIGWAERKHGGGLGAIDLAPLDGGPIVSLL